MRLAMAKRDSLKQIKENQLLLQQKLNREAADSADAEENTVPEIKTLVDAPANDKSERKNKNVTTAAILINEEKRNKKFTR